MKPVNYDDVASKYDDRYARNRYEGIQSRLGRFLADADGVVAEVGCGTGHWLAEFASRSPTFVGVDLSEGMLRRAKDHAPGAMLVRGTADRLPLASGSVNRIFCVNALHHFPAKDAFISECRRVLQPSGRFLTIGLDPHHGGDSWWIYDYFPAARAANLRRSPSTEWIRSQLSAAGFFDIRTNVAQHIPAAVPFDVALQRGLLARHSTSELMVIDDDDFAAGMARLHAEKPVLRASLTIFATEGCARG